MAKETIVSGTYNVTAADFDRDSDFAMRFKLRTSIGPIVLNLPQLSTLPANNNTFWWMDVDNNASVNSITINAFAGDTINGASSLVFTQNGVSGEIGSIDTTRWLVGTTQESVTSVFGRTGDVVAQTGDYDTSMVPENTNLYYTDTRADARIALQKGVANGLATLDSGGKVPTTQLPSYVDDVLEYADIAAFPIIGETGKIYVALDTNKTYRWGGSAYFEISPSEVNSVFGRIGIVTAQNGDYNTSQITESINLFFTDERAQDAVGGILTDTTEIDFTYDDALGQISALLKPTTVTAGSYGSGTQVPALTVDAKGRLTGVVNTPIAITSTQVTDFTEAAQDAVGAMVSSEFIYTDATPLLSLRARAFTNNASHSIVTVAAAANGFQVSSTRDSIVNYSVSITSAVQIGVVTSVGGYVALEIAATNSAVAGDRQEIGRAGNSQTIGLALALSLTQVISGQIGGVVPAGYYARLRSVNTAGTPTYAYLSGQEVLL